MSRHDQIGITQLHCLADQYISGPHNFCFQTGISLNKWLSCTTGLIERKDTDLGQNIASSGLPHISTNRFRKMLCFWIEIRHKAANSDFQMFRWLQKYNSTSAWILVAVLLDPWVVSVGCTTPCGLINACTGWLFSVIDIFPHLLR